MSAESYQSLWTNYLYNIPFRQGFVKAGGLNTRYVQAGREDAPKVLMLHGTGGTWENWCANLGPMSQDFDCYAIDMVGAGLTDKPDTDYEIAVYVDHIRAFLDRMGIERLSMLGLSLGGWISARFAVTYPEMVDKLVLISSSGLLIDAQNSSRIQATRMQAVENPTMENMRTVFRNLIKDESLHMDDLLALRQIIYSRPDMKQAMRHIVAIQDPEVRQRNILYEDEWRSITAPALVIISNADRDVYVTTSRKLAELAGKKGEQQQDHRDEE